MTINNLPIIHDNAIQFIVVDLFCGAGGTTTGAAMAEFDGKALIKVVAAVNHDENAIKSHEANHPETTHFREDIKTLKMRPLKAVVDAARKKYPNAKLILWASLECTNFSNAKGGMPRNADSRTLAMHLFRYITGLDPDLIMIENVVEFMAWGPLDANGKPVSRKKGRDWMAWRQKVCGRGYVTDWAEMNAANYGGYTSRNRLFGIFAKDQRFITWPEVTHAKNPEKHKSFGADLKKWMPVKDVLDFSDEGESIFTPGKLRSEKTRERIYAGLIKHVAGMSQKEFLMKYNSTDPNTGEHRNADVNNPSPTLTVQRNPQLIQVHMLHAHYGSEKDCRSINSPCGTLTTKDRFMKVTAFMDQQYGNGAKNPKSLEDPSTTITNKPKHNLIQAFVMDTQFNNVGTDIDSPLGVVTANRKYHYIMNPQYLNAGGCIDKPCFTLIARMDKMPPYLITCDCGAVGIEVYETDTPMERKIKEFMAMYGIIDIKMRPLRDKEMLKIQGFPEDYKLKGTSADRKKFIGNSVETGVVKKWTEALAMRKMELSL